MNILVPLLAIVATALGASIPIESSNVVREPSHSVPDDVEGKQSDNNGIIENAVYLLLMPLYTGVLKSELIYQIVDCVFYPDNCKILYGSGSDANNGVPIKGMANALQNLATSISPEKNRFKSSSFQHPASTSVQNPVNPVDLTRQFLTNVPPFWIPYGNFVTPISARNEMPKAAYPPLAGNVIPYFNSLTRLSDPSLINTATQKAEGVVPAGTVLQATP